GYMLCCFMPQRCMSKRMWEEKLVKVGRGVVKVVPLLVNFDQKNSKSRVTVYPEEENVSTKDLSVLPDDAKVFTKVLPVIADEVKVFTKSLYVMTNDVQVFTKTFSV